MKIGFQEQGNEPAAKRTRPYSLVMNVLSERYPAKVVNASRSNETWFEDTRFKRQT
jgi:hypothetical protein